MATDQKENLRTQICGKKRSGSRTLHRILEGYVLVFLLETEDWCGGRAVRKETKKQKTSRDLYFRSKRPTRDSGHDI